MLLFRFPNRTGKIQDLLLLLVMFAQSAAVPTPSPPIGPVAIPVLARVTFPNPTKKWNAVFVLKRTKWAMKLRGHRIESASITSTRIASCVGKESVALHWIAWRLLFLWYTAAPFFVVAGIAIHQWVIVPKFSLTSHSYLTLPFLLLLLLFFLRICNSCFGYRLRGGNSTCPTCRRDYVSTTIDSSVCKFSGNVNTFYD